MRGTNEPLRGLLKKSNRSNSGRKNRVVFDETRNQFFDADYIILIREDCGPDDEDNACTCGDHDFAHINFMEDSGKNGDKKYSQDSDYPSLEYVETAALSPPDGYKDSRIKSLMGANSYGQIFDTNKHLHHFRVLQKIQEQNQTESHLIKEHQNLQPILSHPDEIEACPKCIECAECAAQAQSYDFSMMDYENNESELNLPPHMALLPVRKSETDQRTTQKEIIAGEETPKYNIQNHWMDKKDEEKENILNVNKNESYIVETITMTTVTERRIVRESTESTGTTARCVTDCSSCDTVNTTKANEIKTMESVGQTSGILKGGKLWKSEPTQIEDLNKLSSEENKRSVRFSVENNNDLTEDEKKLEGHLRDLIPIRKHSNIFHNVLRPNSAMRQLFPSVCQPSSLPTDNNEDGKKDTTISNNFPNVNDNGSIYRAIERNSLRRSLIKKRAIKSDISLEERIKQLTCDIEESLGEQNVELETDNSIQEEENIDLIQTLLTNKNENSLNSLPKDLDYGSERTKLNLGKLINSSSSKSVNEGKDEISFHTFSQECRCPAAPDLGMGTKMPASHTQVHQTPPRHNETKKPLFSNLSPLTACVAGQKEDMTYYTLAVNEKGSVKALNRTNLSAIDINSAPQVTEITKVVPDVIAGTPGQQKQEINYLPEIDANSVEKTKKKNKNISPSTVDSDDDEQNDYGFNRRPSVRGIKANANYTNEIAIQIQEQLGQVELRNSSNTYGPVILQQNANSSSQGTLNNESQVKDNSVLFGFDGIMGSTQYYQQPQNNEYFNNYGEDMIFYQNRNAISMEQYYRKCIKSPTHRPESPPPLRSYRQAMVIIPYRNETINHFYANGHHTGIEYRRNIVEHQQVDLRDMLCVRTTNLLNPNG